MKRLFLIDGYNLIYQIRELSAETSKEWEEQRQKLIRRLVGFSADTGAQFQVVFDAQRTRRSEETFPGVRVDYAAPSADDYIRRIIARHADDPHLVIVSSDRKDIGHYACTNGLQWLTASQFWKQMTSIFRNQSPRSSPEEKGSAPPGWTAQDDDWLKKAFEN